MIPIVPGDAPRSFARTINASRMALKAKFDPATSSTAMRRNGLRQSQTMPSATSARRRPGGAGPLRDPAAALGDLCSKTRRRARPFLLDRRPHEQKRYERHGIRHRVGREWQHATDPEERAAQGLAYEIGPLHTCL